MSAAAIKLEMLWNHLANTHDFSLLCGYAMGNFYKDATIDDVCRHHTHVGLEHRRNLSRFVSPPRPTCPTRPTRPYLLSYGPNTPRTVRASVVSSSTNTR